MNRLAFAISCAVLIVLSSSGMASASGVNHSGQLRFGAAAPAPAMVPSRTTGVPELVPGAGTNTYFDWSRTLGDNGDPKNGVSPHGGYTTATVKCVVCHSVHYAGPLTPAGSPEGTYTVESGNNQADTLLRIRANNSCIYCHATSGSSVGVGPVYDGDPNSPGHPIGKNCDMCHSSVHGDPTDISVASLAGYLLKLMPQDAVGGQPAPTQTMLDAMTVLDHDAENQGFSAGEALGATPYQYATDYSPVLRERAVGVFCAECHAGAYATAAPGATTNVNGSSLVSYSGHRIAASATTTWNANATISSGAVRNATIAWQPATACKSCHDSKGKYGQDAFPHGWGGTKMWLMVAPEAGSAETTLPYDTDPGSGFDENSPQLSDGVCLKCHVAPGGAAGVGKTF